VSVTATELKPVYLLTGSDRPKIETALGRLRRRFAPEATEIVSAVEASGSEAVALCNAGSLFGDARLVVVFEVDGRRTGEGRATGAWKAADHEAVAEYLAAPAAATVLALVGAEVKKDSALAKACAKAGQVLAYDVPKRERAKWVAEQFKLAGAHAEPDACAALLHLVGDDPRALATEVDKLATWAGGEPIGEREVELLVAATAETPSFALTDAWAARDPGRALEASETIFERDGRPRRDTAPRLAAALAGHLSRLRQMKRLAEQGSPPKDAAAKLRMHPFYAQKVYAQAEGFSEGELRDATVRLAELDLALKGDSRLAPDLELQRAIVDLSREVATRG
jgi:DNA polymerase-3 subunit delta